MNGLNVLMMGTEQFSKIEPAAMIFTANLSAPASSRKCSDNFPHPNHSIHLTGVLSFLASCFCLRVAFDLISRSHFHR